MFACTMDCKSCHPKFDISLEQHVGLKVCSECHKSDNIANIDMGAACGADCFSCHPVEKLNRLGIKEHSIMNGCQECHKGENFQENGIIKMNNMLDLKNFINTTHNKN